jgi:AraC family transcriptional regulator, regulatory protein of adaptative response / methylated-DNA-[protein]-cysteine methyltransferase
MQAMNEQQAINYNRVAQAIDFIKANFKEQPSLEQIAQQVNLSVFHFQRLFTDWAGVSPKQFIAYLSLAYAKSILKEKQGTLLDVAADTGLSGSGRLHDLFVKLEGMSPGEFKNGGAGLRINYSFSENLFGRLLIASTGKGICYMAFIEDENTALHELKGNFPNATYVQGSDDHQQNALKIFSRNRQELKQIKVHLKGTDFQLNVWESLLKIPMGVLSSYGSIAGAVGQPKAARAVGSAIGDNPVAFIIPCHRVIQATGSYGQYRWGSTRKSAMIGWEAAVVNR